MGVVVDDNFGSGRPPQGVVGGSPVAMAAGGAMIGATLTNSWTGAIVGCIVCYLIGVVEQKRRRR